MAKKENMRISFEKAENGFVITQSWDEINDKGYPDYKTKKFIANTAKDTQKIMQDLSKEVK